ncbi:hypothetical protein ACIBEJ_24795 [Nonomuraea sp. NPDC050790]|uniref:hypothetical protein n=1 Tax=Nonomuraea sp. NPDC050790 TaxID=3364371 RepID=UPI00378E65AC
MAGRTRHVTSGRPLSTRPAEAKPSTVNRPRKYDFNSKKILKPAAKPGDAQRHHQHKGHQANLGPQNWVMEPDPETTATCGARRSVSGTGRRGR